MWQFLLAAAVAGSTGFVANHLLHHPNNIPPDADRRTSEGDDSSHHHPPPNDEIFRFSSPGSGKKSNKQENKKEEEEKEEEEKSTQKKDRGSGVNGSGNGGGFVDETGKVWRRRGVHVCLKRRKTGKNCETRPKCGSCLSKDGSSFNWGLGLGLMYMMSSEKSEIRKLNTAIDETAKVVKELKTELYWRRVSQGAMGEETDVFNVSACKKSQKTIGNANDGKASGQIASYEGECASSALTEELQDVKLSELEAEVESELQKLPWSIGEASSAAEPKMGTDISDESLHGHTNEVLGLHYSIGVSPPLLKQKLSHVLIEQQEKQIVELESELHSTGSKLSEREAELRTLKDCIRRLSNFSISAGSDEDVDARLADEEEQEEEEEEEEDWSKSCDGRVSDVVGSESRISPVVVVGMKRPIQP